MKSLTRTAQAEIDLINIWTFIAADNPNAADNLLRALDKKSQLLCQNPEIGVSRDDIAENLRCLIHKNYLILYQVKADTVEVVRYLHGAKKLMII